MEFESFGSDIPADNSFQVVAESDSLAESGSEEDCKTENEEDKPTDASAVFRAERETHRPEEALQCCRWSCTMRGRRCIEDIRKELYETREMQPMAFLPAIENVVKTNNAAMGHIQRFRKVAVRMIATSTFRSRQV